MKKTIGILAAFAALLAAATPGETDFSSSPHVKLKGIGMRDARWTEGFWAERVEQSRRVVVPEMWKNLQVRGNAAWFGNLRIAAGLEKGQFSGTRWSDGDVYKWLEGAALVYAGHPDPDLDRLLDSVIEVIAKAQQPDGYISTQIQLTSAKRWSAPRNHEVYNLGHLFTAACIHQRVTGKDNLMAVARRAGDYLYGVFKGRPQALAHFSAPSNLMGIVELYRATRDPKYLELAQIFVDMRGTEAGGTDHFQDRVPLRKETEAVGHAMHATYLYSTAADIFAETGEPALFQAIDRLWRNVTEKKMFVTGSVGPMMPGVMRFNDVVVEAFGKPYQLPNRDGYNETCANIGNAMWNRRMLALTSEARYADVMEQVLYNAMLPGISLDGKRYFYTNVHRRFGDEMPFIFNESLERWENTTEAGAARSYCCPPNVLRTTMKTAQWAYGVTPGAVWVVLYGGSTLRTVLPDGGLFALAQQTDYPWSGRVRIEVGEAPKGESSVMLRIPGWAESATIRVNGKPWSGAAGPGSFAQVRRAWSRGDVMELELPMPVRLVEGNPYSDFLQGQAAVMRGPLVYCLESPDLPAGSRVDEIRLNSRASFTAKGEPALLRGVTTIEVEARRRPRGNWSGLLYRTLLPLAPETVKIRLIPYYAWANRGASHMSVWLPVGD